MTDMTLGAARAASRSGEPGRLPGRQSNRFPELSELGGEQFVDGGEFLIDTSSALVPAPGNQTDPAIAFDGTNFLVVWEDRRSGSYSDICGTRVTPQGTLLDPSGFVISQAPYDQRYPALAFDGANFLVVWDDYRRGHAFDIYGTRVTPGGKVLDPAGFIITQEMNDQTYPALGFDGENFLVAWQDYVDDVEEPDIYGTRVTPQGTVLDTNGFVITQAARGQFDPVVGFGGTRFLVAWQDQRDSVYGHIYGNLVTRQGQVVVPNDLVISYSATSQGYPALGFNGENFLVVWQDIAGAFPPTLSTRGARVTPGGMVLDPDGITISSSSGTRPALGSDGEDFLVAWEGGSGGNFNIYGARVTPDGTVLDPSSIGISRAAGMQGSPAIGFGGDNYLVAWHDFRNSPGASDIYGARVTPGGTVLDTVGIVISQATKDQLAPALGFGGANFLVVWEDRSGSYTDIYGARVTPGGTVLDPAGIVISQAPDWQHSPALGFDGANFLVVWEDCRNGDTSDIYGARVTPGGVLLDTGGLAITQAQGRQYSPALGFDGANFLVVWQDHRGGSFSDIYGARVTAGGTVLDPAGIAITQATRDQSAPVLEFDGTNFLTVWEDYRGGTSSDVYGARVTPGGAVLDLAGIVISQARNDQSTPALGFDGAEFLVVWGDYRRSVWPDIYGARVAPGGAVLDTAGIAISLASKDQFAPALGFDGANFLVIWEDYRSSNNPDIYGALVAPDGTVSDEGSVVRQAGNQTGLALARGAGSQLFLVYQGWAGTVGDKTYNTDRIWGKMDPASGGSIEEGQVPTARGSRSMATIVRGVLVLGAVDSRQNTGYRAELLDISGRSVAYLHPGANDVRALAPGVYFVTGERRGAGDAGRTRKVAIQR
jgi:hypothetical protein